MFKHVFWGEEALLACIAYTHGYDCYTPPVMHASHAYASNEKKKSWRDEHQGIHKRIAKQQQVASEKLIEAFLDPHSATSNPLTRSVREFWLASGFRFTGDNVVEQTGDVCGQMARHLQQ